MDKPLPVKLTYQTIWIIAKKSRTGPLKQLGWPGKTRSA
jgi:hypothetical protein